MLKAIGIGRTRLGVGLGGGVLCGGIMYGTWSPALCTSATTVEQKRQAISALPVPMSKLLAEAVGTALIVQGGCGVVCALKYANSNLGSFGLSAVWGTTVCLAVVTLADTSNP